MSRSVVHTKLYGAVVIRGTEQAHTTNDYYQIQQLGTVHRKKTNYSLSGDLVG